MDFKQRYSEFLSDLEKLDGMILENLSLKDLKIGY